MICVIFYSYISVFTYIIFIDLYKSALLIVVSISTNMNTVCLYCDLLITSTLETFHLYQMTKCTHHVDGLVQDWSNSSALAMELLQSWAEPSMHVFLGLYCTVLCVMNTLKTLSTFLAVYVQIISRLAWVIWDVIRPVHLSDWWNVVL